MLVADAVFHDKLVAAYGHKRCGDMRYRREHPEHPEVEQAGAAFVAASDAWRELVRSCD